jgi:hypothetical protein
LLPLSASTNHFAETAKENKSSCPHAIYLKRKSRYKMNS